MNDLIKLSNDMQDNIFQYKIDKFNKQVVELINCLTEEIEVGLASNNEKKVLMLSRIIDNLNFAFSNKDFLLFADILKYELEPNIH